MDEIKTELKIEKDIPMPEPRAWGVTAALRKMDVGDSIFFRGRKTNRVTNITSLLAKKTGLMFTTRMVDGGTRVWRIK